MNTIEKKSVKSFIGSIANKDYASAQTVLEQVITEKMKNKVRNIVKKSKKETQKG
jgi:hypothetical protein